MRNAFLRALGVAGVAVGMCAYVASAQPAGKTLIPVDVGFPTVAGSTVVGAGGVITVKGGGNDIWGNSDNFHYAYFRQTGDFDYVMKVESLVGNSGDGGWSKVELMARREDPASPNVGPQGGDEHISNMTTRKSGDTANGAPAGVNYRGPQWRPVRDGASTWTAPNPGYPPNMPDNWVRLERVGSVFWMYTSNDGTTWNQYNPFNPQGWDTAGSWPPGVDNAPNSAFVGPAWGADCFVGIAVTSHNDAADPPTEAVVSNFKDWTPVPIAITTQPPATTNVSANSTLSIPVVATGDPVHYEWRKGGVALTTNQMGATYTKSLCQVSDSGTYTVRLYGAKQTEVISAECVVTVTVDTTPPTIVAANAFPTFTKVTVQYSEPVNDTALTASNYTFDKGITVSSVARVDQFKVDLTTTKMAENTVYELTVNNVQDTATPPNAIAANSKISVQSYAFKTGVVLHKFWENVSGNNIAALEADPRFPDNPTSISIEPMYEWPANGGNEGGSNYGNQLIAWFIPPSNGSYVFFTCSDDPSNLYLSTDDNPANKKLIAQETGWSGARQWLAVGAGTVESKRSDQFLNTEWPDGNVINLVGGRKYYMESVHTEGGGGDNVGATYITAGAADPDNGSAPTITGAVVGAYVDPTKLPPVIMSQPPGSITLAPGASTNLSVTADGATGYQWTRNGYNIAGATSPTYAIASAGTPDIGQYRCTVSNPVGALKTGPCNVLVTATGVYAIEAEDFDNNGQPLPAASTMPYLGGAYDGLSAVKGVDYNNDDDPANNQVNGHPVYRYGGDLSVAGGNATMGNESPPGGGQFANTRAGEWTMTANYKIGWVGGGNWGNYTRTFPTPAKSYHVVAAQSYDGLGMDQLDGALGIVTAGVGTATQTVQPVGVFRSEGTGGWSRNNLVVMTDTPGGNAKTVDLGGNVTLRWTYNSGDADYLVFIPAAAAGPKIDSIAVTGGKIVITWQGTATLQSTATVPAADAAWTDVAGATSPTSLNPPATGNIYYRLKQ